LSFKNLCQGQTSLSMGLEKHHEVISCLQCDIYNFVLDFIDQIFNDAIFYISKNFHPMSSFAFFLFYCLYFSNMAIVNLIYRKMIDFTSF
jgi:hypothetical protein